MSLYAVDGAYDLGDWYENTGAYDLNAGVDTLLDLTRHIVLSDQYMFQGVCFPKGPDIYVAPGQTYSASLNLQPNTYLVSVSGFSGNNNQFTLRVWDKGANTDLYYGQFGWFPTVIGNMTGQFNMGQPILISDKDKPFGPYFFKSPLIILPPGTLQCQITNVESVTQVPTEPGILQILFGLAVPKTTTTLDNRRTVYSQDPSGINTLQSISSVIGG